MNSTCSSHKKTVCSIKEMEKHRKECEVCGDQANGYNFGVLTCESCKAFFRRTVSKRKISCPFNNSCGITAASRRFCQACRLKKCFSVGMRANMKLNNLMTQRKQVKKNTTLERILPKTRCECSCQCGFFPKGTIISNVKDENISESISAEKGYVAQERDISNCHPSSFGFYNDHTREPIIRTNEIPRRSPESSDLYSTIEMTGKYNTLLPTEKMLLQELIRAAAPLNSPIDMQFENDQLSLLDIVRITETALRRIVCMAGEIHTFRSLPLEDKKILIKGSCSELMILRGVMAYDSNRKTWSHSFTQDIRGMEIKLDVLQQTVASKHFEEHKRFLESFDVRVRKAESVIIVLMAILIFQSNRTRLADRKKVKEAQDKYFCLLKKVLECEFGHTDSEEMFRQLLENLQSLQELNQGLVQIYSGFDSSQLDPLLKELFDM